MQIAQWLFLIPRASVDLEALAKRQTALEYAYRYREDYKAILWVRADSVTSLVSSMIELAQLLELPERDEQDQKIIIQAVLRWLRINTDWLLIYDNVDDLSLAEPYFPKAGAGHLLFATRAHALAGLAQRLEVQQMEPETGALLLLRRASLIPLQSSLVGASPSARGVACEISQELDGLPLALDQAGAYIKETPCSLGEYLVRYRTRRQEVLEARGRSQTDFILHRLLLHGLSRSRKLRRLTPLPLICSPSVPF